MAQKQSEAAVPAAQGPVTTTLKDSPVTTTQDPNIVEHVSIFVERSDGTLALRAYFFIPKNAENRVKLFQSAVMIKDLLGTSAKAFNTDSDAPSDSQREFDLENCWARLLQAQ